MTKIGMQAGVSYGPFFRGSMRARIERRLLSTGNCYCCKRPWRQRRRKDLGFWDGVHHSRQLDGYRYWGLVGVESHTTPYADDRGCFPLCEGCWTSLATPEARIPFYRQLFTSWERNSSIRGDLWDEWGSCLLSLVNGL